MSGHVRPSSLKAVRLRRNKRRASRVASPVGSAPGDAPDTDASAVPKRLRYGIGVVLFAFAVGLPLLRQTGTPSWRTIWAEDGSIYFQEAYRHGGLAVLFRGYAGYLQLPPRVLGGLAELVPVRNLALYFAVSAQVVNALLACFVYWASAGWITSRLVRLALASLVVLMPVLAFENTATITNTIWTFAAVAPWALVSLSERPRAVALRSIVALLATTATLLSVVFLPLAIGYALIRRTRATWVVAAAFGLGLVMQAGVALNTTDDRAQGLGAVRQASKVPGLTSVRTFAQYLVGDKGIDWVWEHRTLLAVLAPLVVLAVLAALLPGADRRNQLLATSFVALALISFVAPVWGRGTNRVTLADSKARTVVVDETTSVPNEPSRRFSRFSVVPVMTLAGATALLLTRSRRRTSPSTARLWSLVFVAQVAVVTTIGFSVANDRSSYPSWPPTVERAYRRQCVAAPPAKEVRIVPSGRVLGFPLSVACADLAP